MLCLDGRPRSGYANMQCFRFVVYAESDGASRKREDVEEISSRGVRTHPQLNKLQALV